MEIDRTKEQQATNKTKDEATTQEKISYSRALKHLLKNKNQEYKYKETDTSWMNE
ncbi:5669_t:CDS:1, partial [Gigaspora margarita]